MEQCESYKGALVVATGLLTGYPLNMDDPVHALATWLTWHHGQYRTCEDCLAGWLLSIGEQPEDFGLSMPAPWPPVAEEEEEEERPF